MADRNTHFNPYTLNNVWNKPAIYIRCFETLLGPMVAAVTDHGLVLLEFGPLANIQNELDQLSKQTGFQLIEGDHPILLQTQKELFDYFSGQLKQFSIPLIPQGNEFAQSVWQTLLEIPYGTTWTYKQQADFMSNPLAIRAIAAANGRNPIAVIVPCHRVIGSNGSLTGYAGGLDKKRWLLQLEKNNSPVAPGSLF